MFPGNRIYIIYFLIFIIFVICVFKKTGKNGLQAVDLFILIFPYQFFGPIIIKGKTPVAEKTMALIFAKGTTIHIGWINRQRLAAIITDLAADFGDAGPALKTK